jgi:hypothetical protein
MAGHYKKDGKHDTPLESRAVFNIRGPEQGVPKREGDKADERVLEKRDATDS